MTIPSTSMATSERRWAVRVRCYYRGKCDGTFLAGRFYFNIHGDRRSSDEHPPTATFRTRAQARKRCRKIRQSGCNWRVSARAVRVVVTTAVEAGTRTPTSEETS